MKKIAFLIATLIFSLNLIAQNPNPSTAIDSAVELF